MSQKSFHPRAIAYVAIIDPTRIHASNQKYHRGAGQAAPMPARAHWATSTRPNQASR